MRFPTFFTFILTAVFSLSAMGEDFKIIANNKITASSISRAELKAILFGNKTNFAGAYADPCLWNASGGDAFFTRILGVSKIQFSQEWVKKELTGAGRAPKTRETPDEVINCVAEQPGGLGFIPASSESQAAGKVKIMVLTD